MTEVEPDVYSTPDMGTETKVPDRWKICPIMKEICVEHNCRFWLYDECMIFTIMKEML